MLNIRALQDVLLKFAVDRDWEQFHNPKNLASAIVVEASELLEIFQWMSQAEAEPGALGPDVLQKLESELADVMIYCLQLAGKLRIDLESAITMKIRANNERYPIDKAKGSSRKYSDL